MAAIVMQLYSCSNRCIFCNPKGSLTKATDKKLKEVKKASEAQAAELIKEGIKCVEVSGTDPIEHPEIASFIKNLKKEYGFEYVILSTHGKNMSDPKLVDKLSEAGLDKVKIPFYGSNARIHDSITQIEGSFDETIKGVENIIDNTNIDLLITSLIMRQNYKDVLNIFSLASNYAYEVGFAIPCAPESVDFTRFSISFDEIKPYLLSLLKEADKDEEVALTIYDIPYCVPGFYDDRIQMTRPPIVGKSYSIRPEFRTDKPNVPSYRVKRALDICKRCKCNDICDGFYEKYLELMGNAQLKSLKPITEIDQ